MKCLYPIPQACLDDLKRVQVVSVELKDGRFFDQVVASEGCIIEVRGHEAIPFAPEEVESVIASHKRWNFREASDARIKCRTADA